MLCKETECNEKELLELNGGSSTSCALLLACAMLVLVASMGGGSACIAWRSPSGLAAGMLIC